MDAGRVLLSSLLSPPHYLLFSHTVQRVTGVIHERRGLATHRLPGAAAAYVTRPAL